MTATKMYFALLALLTICVFIHTSLSLPIKKQAAYCRLEHEPMGLDIDVRNLTRNLTQVDVPGIRVDGKDKIMVFGICRGLPRSFQCGGKNNSATSACLVDSLGDDTSRSANNSQIISTITRTSIHFSGDRMHIQFDSPNMNCSNPTNHSAASIPGARIEVFCSHTNEDKPRYIGLHNCTYVFEWGSQQMCLDKTNKKKDAEKTNIPTRSPIQIKSNDTEHSERGIDDEHKPKSGLDTHIETLKDSDNFKDHSDVHEVKESQSTTTTQSPLKQLATPGNLRPNPVPQPAIPNRMNNMHRILMISLIMISLAAFVTAIFILDKKTRLGVSLGAVRRQTRQAFSAQVPYSRVDHGYSDGLDL